MRKLYTYRKMKISFACGTLETKKSRKSNSAISEAYSTKIGKRASSVIYQILRRRRL
jgi:hypothetical protein